MKNWFEVDSTGLRKLIEDKGPVAAIYELVQNAWDQQVTHVDIRVEVVPGRPLARIVVEDDDPQGFASLDHAYTLFAESTKKGDPTRRGRFNIGEKLVLSLCQKATISSTTGTIRFDENGRHHGRATRSSGSSFDGIIRMTREQFAEVKDAFTQLIVPQGIVTTFNGQRLEERVPLKEVRAALPTEFADSEGVLRKTVRQTDVRIYAARDGVGRILEMGIPVVDTGDKYDVDVSQKVPLSFSRDNVPPSYLQSIRTLVLNEMHAYLSDAEANEAWVRSAASDTRCSNDAITNVVSKRFGDRRVSYDPSDPEGTSIAAAEGWTVVHAGSMSQGEWANARRAGAIQPAGKVTPSPRIVLSFGGGSSVVDETDYDLPMQRLADYAREVGLRLLGVPIAVILVNDRNWRPAHSTRTIKAAYGQRVLTLNVPLFDLRDRRTINGILIHEFAHHFSSNHLSEEYHDALRSLGADLTELALVEPDLFDRLNEVRNRSDDQLSITFGRSQEVNLLDAGPAVAVEHAGVDHRGGDVRVASEISDHVQGSPRT